MTLEPKDRGTIFNIQRFSIHDGPGIRTIVFLKGCPLRCFWCHNPESQRWEYDLFFNADKCVLCGACIPACPQGANRIENGRMQIDRSVCTTCGECVQACHSSARSIMGQSMSVGEIMEIVLRDKSYYRNSGGGVTICGGDAVAQPGFALSLLKRCREEGLHTNLDTSGYASWDIFSQLVAHADLVYLDIKCIDPELHKRGTGVDNRPILDNAIKTAKLCPIHVRVPVIPHFNDTEEEISRIALFAKNEMGCRQVDLLKYNSFAESKYARLGRPYEVRNEYDGSALDHRMKTLNALIRDILGPEESESAR